MHKKLLQPSLCLALILCEAIRLPIYAEEQSFLERYNCGRIGIVSLQSSRQSTLASGHSISSAQIAIPSRKVKQLGIVHIMMGGNHRIFTRNINDNYRAIDATSTENPVIMSIKAGGFLYGKLRQEIFLSLKQESYTCIPLR